MGGILQEKDVSLLARNKIIKNLNKNKNEVIHLYT